MCKQLYLIEDNIMRVQDIFDKIGEVNCEGTKSSSYVLKWINEKGEAQGKPTTENGNTIDYSPNEDFSTSIKNLDKSTESGIIIDLALTHNEQKRAGEIGVERFRAKTAIQIISTFWEWNENIKILIISGLPNMENYWEAALDSTSYQWNKSVDFLLANYMSPENNCNTLKEKLKEMGL